MKKIQLTKKQAHALCVWLSDQLHDMKTDEYFIEEEDPGLIDAIECLKDQLI